MVKIDQSSGCYLTFAVFFTLGEIQLSKLSPDSYIYLRSNINDEAKSEEADQEFA